jgi:hypothetical protein
MTGSSGRPPPSSLQANAWLKDHPMRGEIEDFLGGFNQPTYRGMRVNGQRIATWSSEHGWSGDGRPDAEVASLKLRRSVSMHKLP